jgi:hypothetical protein
MEPKTGPARDNRNVKPEPPDAIPPDYDQDPGRFRLARAVLREHALAGDVHGRVADRFVSEDLLTVLDVGCGEGELPRCLP